MATFYRCWRMTIHLFFGTLLLGDCNALAMAPSRPSMTVSFAALTTSSATLPLGQTTMEALLIAPTWPPMPLLSTLTGSEPSSKGTGSAAYRTMTSKILFYNFADLNIKQQPWAAYTGAFEFDTVPPWIGKLWATWNGLPIPKTMATMSAEFSPILVIPKALTNVG